MHRLISPWVSLLGSRPALLKVRYQWFSGFGSSKVEAKIFEADIAESVTVKVLFDDYIVLQNILDPLFH